MTEVKSSAANGQREWVEPEISELEVTETAGFPGVGGDGGAFPDCTRS
ncbi:hypothetical protein [Brevundimonas sp.]